MRLTSIERPVRSVACGGSKSTVPAAVAWSVSVTNDCRLEHPVSDEKNISRTSLAVACASVCAARCGAAVGTPAETPTATAERKFNSVLADAPSANHGAARMNSL
eukprot:Amastigsp_a842952_4.p6 type:complete len:105 gc:universal Amastigsp_a842952_4:521-835(+)